MKRKQIALFLSLLLSVSPVIESAAVWGADFTDGMAVEQTQEEETEEVSSQAAETPEEVSEESWTSGEDTDDFGTDEGDQPEVFAEEASEEPIQSTESSVSKGTYEVAYITKEQYNECLDGEDCPDINLKTFEDTTLTEALGKMEGENTGYCLVLPHNVEGAEDIVVPKGLNVYVGFADGMLVKSITPNGNIAFRGIGNGEDNIEIREGNGTVTFQQLYMTGTLIGTGSDDTVIFSGGDSTLGGISRIENIYFGDNCWNLKIKGKSEFYNLYNETGHDGYSIPVWIRIEGYSKEKVPVFHKSFDWGKGTFEDEENGNKWAEDYRLGVCYEKSFDEEWEDLDIGSGNQAVNFEMDMEDILEVSNRIYAYADNVDYELSMDGKVWYANEHKLYRIYRYQNAGEKTAQEIFENDNMDNFEYPEEGDYFLGSTSDINQMMQVIEADYRKNNTAGYYNVDLTKNGVIDTLDIPSGIKGINFWGSSDYDEETDTHVQYPVKIGSIKTQKEQTVRLGHAIVNSGLSVSGDGVVQIQASVIQGTLKGTGANDTVTFIQDSQLGGLSGVEKVHFGKQCGSLNLRGAAEFYDIYNDTGRREEQFPVSLQVEGTDQSGTITFHKAFDWKSGTFSNEEGYSWTEPYSLAIQYFKSFDVEDWERIDTGTGFQSVKFDMPDTDIIDMLERVQVHVPDNGYGLDMDGKTWRNDGNAADIEICQSTEGQTAQKLFDAYGKREEYSDEGLSWLTALPNTGQASRYLAAYQEKKNGEGYYIVHIGQKAQITGTLTVPDGVNAVKYAGPTQYDEKTDTNRWLPVKLSSVNVPAGKKVVLMDMLVNGDNLTITGEGTTELLDTRLNTNVTANTLEITKAAVKNLNCKNLLMEGEEERSDKLVVTGYLSFEKASLNPNCEIYAEPGSYLKLGEIDCTKFDERDNLHIFTGKDGSLSAEIYFAGELKLGTYMHPLGDGSERDLERGMNLITCDEQRAKKDNACFTEDCFSETYHYNEDGSWWGNYPVVYKNEAICLATIDKKLDEKKILEFLSVEVALSEEEGSGIGLFVPEKNNDEWEDYAVDGDKRLTDYLYNENGQWTRIKANAYFEIHNKHTAKEISRVWPSCSSSGYVNYKCETCGYTWQETLGAYGHSWDNGVVTKEATCTTAGTKTYTCKDCRSTYTETIKATGEHKWDEGVITKEATCTEDGVKTYTCTVCKETKTETIKAEDAHKWDEGVITKEATCTEDGVKTYTCKLCKKTRTETIKATNKHQWDKGVITQKATCTKDGVRTYTCSVCHTEKTETIPALKHKWSAWKTKSAATVLKAKVQERICSTCKKTQTRTTGEKLTPKATLNVKSLKLKKKQKTTAFKITGMAKGDYVKSWKSSDTNVVKVSGKKDGTCTITAQKQAGTATITITFASGLVKTLKVKVQASTVKTTAISNIAEKATLKKGKTLELKPVLEPITSGEEITYESSDPTIAKVSKKGVVTALKPGTVTITIKSGKLTVTCKITVKK